MIWQDQISCFAREAAKLSGTDMPDDYHPPMPRRNPEDIDLGAIKADLHDDRECRHRHRLDRAFLAALPVKSALSTINRGSMRKTLTATIVALVSTPALANSGHIIQVHHGADCVEFALVEDANTTCGPNVYVGGILNPECTALIPWYGINAGEGVGQTPLTASQLPFFLDAASSIDTAYRLYQSELQLEYAQAGIQGVIVIDNPSEVASLDTTSAIGFTVNGTLTCKDISAASGTHTVNSVVNLNTPPTFYQIP